MEFIPYGRHFIDEDDIKSVVEVLRSDFITQGPKIREFEEKLSAYCGARFCVCFSSGTAALHAAYFALGLRKGDKFITTPISFVATANAGLLLGAEPVFADVERDTGNIDPEAVREIAAETQGVRMISVVHYAGHPVDMERIKEIAEKHGLRVVEDACHALGAEYKGKKVGCCELSDAVVFSFHPVKHITTGEGGAVLTNDEKIYKKLVMFRNHGITKDPEDFVFSPHGDWYYEMQFLGCNYRFSDIQAALGLSQLRKLGAFLDERRKIARFYNLRFAGVDFFNLPVEKSYAKHAFHLYVVRLVEDLWPRKNFIMKRLRERGVGTQVHYIPIYLHPYYRKLGYREGLCPEAESFYKSALSLPIFPAMTKAQRERVVEAVLEVLSSST